MRLRRALCILALTIAAPGAPRSLPADEVVLVAGGEQSAEGLPATQTKLRGPFGVAFDPTGQMVLVEIDGHRVLKIDRSGVLTRIGGSGKPGSAGDGGPALHALFKNMHSLAIAPNGDIYLADTGANRVRKIDARTGVVSGLAGTGEKGFSGDGGPAAAAKCGGVYCVALDPSGERLYLADLDNRRVRLVTLASGIITTVAGNGERGAPQDGVDAKSSPLVDPRAVAADALGNVYILRRSGHALRVVDPQGKIRTVAGTGRPGSSGDGGPARQATLRGPKHLCVDRTGAVLIADTDNHIIRRYLPDSGTIERVAGSGRKGTAGIGGPADQLELNEPHGVCVDRTGIVYIVDSRNNRVLKIAP